MPEGPIQPQYNIGTICDSNVMRRENLRRVFIQRTNGSPDGGLYRSEQLQLLAVLIKRPPLVWCVKTVFAHKVVVWAFDLFLSRRDNHHPPSLRT
jgi:hypothetical protein